MQKTEPKGCEGVSTLLLSTKYRCCVKAPLRTLKHEAHPMKGAAISYTIIGKSMVHMKATVGPSAGSQSQTMGCNELAAA